MVWFVSCVQRATNCSVLLVENPLPRLNRRTKTFCFIVPTFRGFFLVSDFLPLRTNTPKSTRRSHFTIHRSPRVETPSDGRREQEIPLLLRKSTTMITGFPVLLGKRRKAEPVMRVHRKKTYGLSDSSPTSINPCSIDNRAGAGR